jgi:hypothetical protein
LLRRRLEEQFPGQTEFSAASTRLLSPSGEPAARDAARAAPPGQVPHFFLNHQTHQRQPGFAHQVADSFLQQPDDLGHGKDHLQVGILFAGQLSEFLHRSLLVDLYRFFIATLSFFLDRKNHLGHYDRG